MNIKTKKGFTIIEVVLVLAIGGLIFLMVFLAFPALQRSQKDSQRRRDYAAFATSVQEYVANNGGKLPKAKADLKKTMLNSEGKDPDGNDYDVDILDNTTSTKPAVPDLSTSKKVYLVLGATCDFTGSGTSKKFGTAGAKNFVIYGYVENQPGYYCQAN